MKIKNTSQFAHDLCDWYRLHYRKLPFRETSEPYNILVSELMLQQTQMDTVIPYYSRFIQRFPTIKDLAMASQSEVLKYWEGLGYYRRAKHLHDTAKIIVSDYNGVFPNELNAIKKLKGVGNYTAGAIHSIAFNQPTPAIDGNVVRVLSRVTAYSNDVSTKESALYFETILKSLIKHETPRDFTQAMMELGALVCKKKPLCEICPVQKQCLAFKHHTQEDYPIKKSKKPIQHESYFTFVLQDQQNQTLLIRRPDKGLLANLMAFPQYLTSDIDLAIKRFNEDFNVTVKHASYLFDIEHIFSHKKWHLHVYRIKTDSDISSHNTYNLNDLPEAISKAHLKIIEKL